jgi:hypothetical protein
VAALGEHESRALGVAKHRYEHRSLGLAMCVHRLGLLGREKRPAQVLNRLAQMITWTVPPSTDHAAPAT